MKETNSTSAKPITWLMNIQALISVDPVGHLTLSPDSELQIIFATLQKRHPAIPYAYRRTQAMM